MDSAHFSALKTGQLVPIKVNTQDDTAFLPAPLPPENWSFPERLWPTLVKAQTLLGTLNGIGRTLPDPQLLLSPLRRREAITSSALEGTYATPQELMLFELSSASAKSESNKTNEWREVANYHQALKEGETALESGVLFCSELFKKLHRILLFGVRSRYNNPGEYRKHQVAIGSDRRYIPPPDTHLESCLQELESYINSDTGSLDPLIKAYLVHYQFEAIHPFYDGNGRIGRVLLALMISKWCGFVSPWLYMSPYFERYKDEYISNMFRVSTAGAWDAWIEFCLRGTITQAEDAIRRVEKLRKLRAEMLEKIKSGASPRTHQIIEGLFSNPIVSVSRLSQEMHVTYPTAKDDIDRLVKAEILVHLEGVRPMAYFSPDIFTVAYDAPEDFL